MSMRTRPNPDAARHPSQVDNQHGPASVEQPSNQSGGDSALVLTVGGVALASGENTLTDGEIHTVVQDMGRVTKAVGDASFTAAADSPAGGEAYAVADTFADATGADLVFIRAIQSAPDFGGDGSALSTSQLKIVAIDIHGFEFADGPRVVGATLEIPSRGEVDISGHLATVGADAEAIGDNTLAHTQTFALTDLSSENAFSFVSGLAISGVA
jgi:hypothetical protein